MSALLAPAVLLYSISNIQYPRPNPTHLLLVMQAFIVILESGSTLLFAGVILGRCVDNIAGHDLLPEGKTAADAWGWSAGGSSVVGSLMQLTGPWCFQIEKRITYRHACRSPTPW